MQTRATTPKNSIDRRQPEKNQEDLSGNEAIKKIQELVEKTETCFFCTGAAEQNSSGTRPMAVQEVDDAGNLWFLSADDSHKNAEVEHDSHVRLYFQGGKHSDFLVLDGVATVSRNKQRIQDLWKPIMKTWFTEGIDDPRITVIRVAPTQGYYWDTKHGIAVAGIKIMIGAATGKTLDDSIQGQLKV